MSPQRSPIAARFSARRVVLAALALSALAGSAVAGNLGASTTASALHLQATQRMGAYTGQSPRSIPQDLRGRARFLDEQLRESTKAPDSGCVVLQTPAPGEELRPDTQVSFLVANTAPTPNFQGMSVAAAQQLAGYFCLSVAVVPSCDGGSDAVTSSSPTSIVTAQCTPPDSTVDIGNQIGVVVSPADDPSPLLMGLAILAATLFLLAAAIALAYYVRYNAARDELAIFKSPRRDK